MLETQHMEILRNTVRLPSRLGFSKYKELLIILFQFIPGLAQFSPGSVNVYGHLNLLACRFAH